MSDIKNKVPWWGKIIAKIVLSKMPLKYKAWRKVGFFKHGDMIKPEYAYQVFKKHYDRVSPRPSKPKDFTVLELGPGDSLFTAVIAFAFGARQCYLVDVSYYAISDLKPYREMAKFVSEKAMLAPGIKDTKTLDELLSICNAHYGTNGLETLCTIPDRSVDFVFSQAVLEHVRKQDFLATLKQIRRIIKDDGICSHSIDLKDHLGGNLNSLRFSEKVWESGFFVRSGFYTNRIRHNKMLALFKEAGFNPEIVRSTHWPKLPTSKKKLSDEFSCLSEQELMISEFDVILRPA